MNATDVKTSGVTVAGAGTKFLNGVYTSAGTEDGVGLFNKKGTHYYVMRHTAQGTTAWWITEWKGGNKNNTVDYYFVMVRLNYFGPA